MNEKNITEAEWKIMHVIWSCGSCTSKQILNELNQKIEWEPTTVKTLLSRLVKKEVIDYEVKGRAYVYFPMVSEMACINNEMNQIIKKVYGKNLQLTSNHFEFYGDGRTNYYSILKEALESNYERISIGLKSELNKKIMVYVHKTQQHLHSALGVINGPNWLRGGLAWDVIHIAPEECFKDIKVDEVIVHLMVQVLVNKINTKIPYWLFQGISAYESKWLSNERIKKAVEKNIEKINPTILNEISNDYDLFAKSDGYELAYTVVEYIVDTFGREKLLRLIHKPTDFLGIFGCSEINFFEKWIEYLLTC